MPEAFWMLQRNSIMYDFIHDIAVRPAPFSAYTAKELWTKPHISNQMLELHLNQETDLASRRTSVIDKVVSWIDSKINLTNKRLCDLGCGPGLYTGRFAEKGSIVTGIDFSKLSINYAKQHSEPHIDYIHADYLTDKLPAGFDVVTLIYTDLCVLSPNQRATLLSRIKSILRRNGYLILDVAGLGLFNARQETTLIEDNLMGGFWSDNDYVGIQKSFVYDMENLTLDRYIIIEPNETWQIYNWFQYYSTEMLKRELSEAGFTISVIAGDLTGIQFVENGDFLGVIAVSN